jgi:hypothetical protein
MAESCPQRLQKKVTKKKHKEKTLSDWFCAVFFCCVSINAVFVPFCAVLCRSVPFADLL